jgi:dynein heavy chain
MKQEVTRQKKQLNWALDEVSYWTEPQREFVPGEDGRIENRTFNFTPPDGVLIHGLFLEGAGWNKTDKRLDDSEPKVLFTPFPVMLVTAVSTAAPADARAGQQNKAAQDLANMDKSYYNCPVYKYPKRLEHYKIFNVYLKAEAAQAAPNPNKNLNPKMKWRLCGTCLLAQKQ